jgi:hypothetical protein
MNILPLILALVLMLSVLMVERLEKLKNQTLVQREYQIFLKMNERQVFNKRQKKLFKENDKDIKQLSFRFFIDKAAREKDESVTKQYRLLNLELMKIVYGEAAFFKNLEQRRPNFLEEMLNAIERAADAAPKALIKRVEDIARLDLEDPELQEAFYHMLKGTISRKKLKGMKEIKPSLKEKSYVSLFSFINYDGAVDKNNNDKPPPQIVIQCAPREILKAIFENDDVVDAIIVRRQELRDSKDNGAGTLFETEFRDKRRQGIEDRLLNFKISSSDKTDYD